MWHSVVEVDEKYLLSEVTQNQDSVDATYCDRR
jgi:hypothetical protein